MKGFLPQPRRRAVIGLIAAYALALQTLLAAFAPLPVNAGGVDFGQLSAICFGAGKASDDPATPVSGKLPCVPCCVAACGATLPTAVPLPLPAVATAVYRGAPQDRTIGLAFARSGPARAPPSAV